MTWVMTANFKGAISRFCRYYGLRKISSPSGTPAHSASSAAAAAVSKKQSVEAPQVHVVLSAVPPPPVHSMSRPIITVTEFTPSTTPEKVRLVPR